MQPDFYQTINFCDQENMGGDACKTRHFYAESQGNLYVTECKKSVGVTIKQGIKLTQLDGCIVSHKYFSDIKLKQVKT